MSRSKLATPDPSALLALVELAVPQVRDHAIYLVDGAGRIVWWNDGAAAVHGAGTEEVTGQSWERFFGGEDLATGWPERLVETAATTGSAEDEGWRVRPDGTRFWAHVGLTALPVPVDGAGCIPPLMACVTRDLTARREMETSARQLTAELDEAHGRTLAALEQAQQARSEAELANRSKDQFLATLSHELRTPLNAIAGWVHLLRAGRLNAEAAQRALETIERNALHQARMIDDILDVSRMVAGKVALELRPLDPGELLAAAVDSLRPSAEAKRLNLRLEGFGRVGSVLGDPARLQQVVLNLVGNAIKFTPPQGTVTVRLAQQGQNVVVEVEDSGQGVAQDLLPHIFEPYRQADEGQSKKNPGLGLGLAIVKHLVDLHDGRVYAHSAGPGQGATFTLSLPSQDLPPQELSGRFQVLSGTPRLAGLRFLVVDDEPDCLEVLAGLLQSEGGEVTCADSAQRALDLLLPGSGLFHVVLSDLSMDGQGGLWLAERIRHLLERPPRLVAVTALTHEDSRQRAVRAGFDAFVSKPVDPGRLLRVLGRLTGRRTTLSEPVVRA
jgi:PAS domain S-box-containing protein